MPARLFILVLYTGVSSIFVQAQNSGKYSLFFESSIFRFRNTVSTSADYLRFSGISLPAYDHQFDENFAYRSYTVINDTIKNAYAEQGWNFGEKDFRNITLGVSTAIANRRRYVLSHSIALNHSMANSYRDILYRDQFHVSDSTNHFFDGRDSSFFLEFYEKTRRIGLVYDFNAAIRIVPRFRFSFGIRNTFSLAYVEKTLVQYHHFVSQRNDFFENDFVCSIFCRDIRLYRNEKPEGNYQTLNSKRRLQYDMCIYARPEFLLGPRKLSTFYFFYGFGLKTAYGNVYRTRNWYMPLWGLGISRQL